MIFRILFALLVVLISACDDERDGDLRAWMVEVRKRHQSQPHSLPPTSAIPEFRYQPASRIDPFDLAKLTVTDERPSGDTVQPDLRREREPLEFFPLDSVRLIGSLRRGREAVALIEADKRVYQLRVGAHLGQDFGKVIAIGDKTVDIEELVPEGGGRWTQRRTQLVLQEKQ